MPADTPNINLLGEVDLSRSPWGRILTWATTYGRYIMITTEIVVLLAFISRFSLDRKLTDLNEEILQKQAIIEANANFEHEFRSLQEKIHSIKTLMSDQERIGEILRELERLLTLDVYFDSLTISTTSITAQVIAASTSGFAQFFSNITSSTILDDIEIGEVKRNPLTGIQFQLTASLAKKTQKIP